MSHLKKTSIGLDIGSRFIKFVELKRKKDGIVLTKFGIKEIPSDLKSDRDKEKFQLISELFSENNIKPSNVNIAAGGQSVFVRFVKLLQTKEDKLKQTMKFEAQNQIPFLLNEVAWDWSLLDKVNLSTKKAVIVAIKKNLVDEIISKLKSIKISVDLIDVIPISLYNCMTFNEDYGREKHGAVVDIGTNSTNLVIFEKGNIWIRSFPVASERIKKAKDEGIEEFISEIERSIEYYFMQAGEREGDKKKLDELILTGGGSAIENVESILANRFNISPKILDPFRRVEISKDMLLDIERKGVKNQLAVAVGLALRGIARLKVEIDFLKEMHLDKYLSQQKNMYSRLSIAAAVLIVISFSVFMRQDYSIKRSKLNTIGEMLDIYQTYEPKIKEIQDAEDILKEKMDILYQTAGSRAIWLDVFGILSEILPLDVWITDVSGIVSLEKSGLARLDLSGSAFSYQSVNGFVSALKSSPSFKDVKPISSSIETDKDTGEEIVKFSITMDVVVGETD